MTDRFLTPRDGDHFPYLGESADAVKLRFENALADGDLETASFAFLELRHRRPKSAWVRRALAQFAGTGTTPIEWLGVARAIARRFKSKPKGRASVYLILLRAQDSAAGPWGVYVGETNKTPEQRYEEHRTGVNASGCVYRRHAALLQVPGRHLRGIERSAAKQIEADLARALSERGILVRGGH